MASVPDPWSQIQLASQMNPHITRFPAFYFWLCRLEGVLLCNGSPSPICSCKYSLDNSRLLSHRRRRQDDEEKEDDKIRDLYAVLVDPAII